MPVLNEANGIGRIVTYLQENSNHYNILEIIVVDGGSTDATVNIAKNLGAKVIHSEKGRAKQMNHGAKVAQGEVFYFLHADTLPPKHFCDSIITAVQHGSQVGCFQMKFDSDSRFLKFFAWFTRLNYTLCRGGDQSLFILNELFFRAGGFDESYVVYEDNEFINRLYKMTDFKILPNHVKTSTRRYEEVGKLKLQYHFGVIHVKNYFGAGPEQLYDYYKRKIVI